MVRDGVRTGKAGSWVASKVTVPVPAKTCPQLISVVTAAGFGIEPKIRTDPLLHSSSSAASPSYSEIYSKVSASPCDQARQLFRNDPYLPKRAESMEIS
jgi:hypothetical protein